MQDSLVSSQNDGHASNAEEKSESVSSKFRSEFLQEASLRSMHDASNRRAGTDEVTQTKDSDKQAIELLSSGKIEAKDQSMLSNFLFQALLKNNMRGDVTANSINKLLEEAKSNYRVELTGPYADKHYAVHNMNANNRDFHNVFTLKDKNGASVPGGFNSFNIHWKRGY